MTLREQIKQRMAQGHAECDDCWYSCPKSGACCNEREADLDVCYCGKDELDALLADVLALLPAEPRTCATCRFWVDDDETAECMNVNSPMFRVYVASDREPWADEWGCFLHEPKDTQK